jgi:hypothetical protein
MTGRFFKVNYKKRYKVIICDYETIMYKSTQFCILYDHAIINFNEKWQLAKIRQLPGSGGLKRYEIAY